MKIKRFNEDSLPFKHLKSDDERVYYKIKVDNSIRKFDIALNKLGLKKAVYRYYGFNIEYFRYCIEDNIIIYLNITLNNSNMEFNILGMPIEGYTNKGDVYVEDYELNANKYNL